MNHQAMMHRAIELALKAEGRTAPNPMVGAVIVGKDGEVISEGFHEKAGTPHAEINALRAAGERADGATIFVSLEPCCHQGKTGPCTDALINARISKVVAGMQDPNPKVAGGGFKQLQDAGIEVHVDVETDRCRWLNRAFCKRIQSGLPWLILKLASTLDGRIADRFGASHYISCNDSLKHVHHLRNTSDCVLIGGATLVKDDSSLTVREIPGRNPARAVLSPTKGFSVESINKLKLFSDPSESTIIFVGEDEFASENKKYPKHIEIVAVPKQSDHLSLKHVLTKLAQHGFNQILCEGGGVLAASLLNEDLVDEVHWIMTPKLIIDRQATPAVSGNHTITLDKLKTLRQVSYKQMGDDFLISGLLSPV